MKRVSLSRMFRRPALIALWSLLSIASAAQVRFRLATPETIELRLKSFSTKNKERPALILKWLGESGCSASGLSEQSLELKLPPNVICVLPGDSAATIVVGAHTDHVDEFGDGVVDNWTGASLLPSLLFSISGERRRHTFVFIGFSAEERRLLGSSYYADHLTSEERSRIVAMVNMDSLGLGPTEVWASHSEKNLLDLLATTSAATKHRVTGVNVDYVGTADSESFARHKIPRITFHSITQATLKVLHSPEDKLRAVQMKDYYESYALIAAYLAVLDEKLGTVPQASGVSK